jgi:hypothetical protein
MLDPIEAAALVGEAPGDCLRWLGRLERVLAAAGG